MKVRRNGKSSSSIAIEGRLLMQQKCRCLIITRSKEPFSQGLGNDLDAFLHIADSTAGMKAGSSRALKYWLGRIEYRLVRLFPATWTVRAPQIAFSQR